MTARVPRISVISPSYNQARFLEATIRSVLGQRYPNLEYIIIDGGSTDGSVDIIRRHAGSLAYWVSERDSGQSSAINKGFARATGDILCWLNSDDVFEDGTLSFVADYFMANPDVDVVCGGKRDVDADGKVIQTLAASYGGIQGLVTFWRGYGMHQPSIFWRRRVYERIGGVDESLHLTMDFDYWLRIGRLFNVRCVDRVLASATVHPGQKTADNYKGYRRAQLRDVLRHYGSPFTLRGWDVRLRLYVRLLLHAASQLARKLVGRA